MCIIIAKEQGVAALSRDNFERAWDHNSDGGGVVWREPDGTVKMQKGIMDKKTFLGLLDKVNTDDRAYIAHFRIRSVGPVVATNCHPFVMDKVTFAHNGTLSITPIDGKTDSETFGLTCLKDKSLDWIKENQKLIEMALGTSKFAFMDNETGEILILNRQNGKERDGCWFSNGSADKPAPVQPYHRYYQDDFDLDGVPGKHGMYRGDKFFGTKKHTEYAATYSKEQRCWLTNYDKTRKTLWYFQHPVVYNRRGLYQIDPTYDVSECMKGIKKKTYANKCRELTAISRLSMTLERKINQYHNTNFGSYTEKNDAECALGSMNAVLNIARRIVQAGYELTEDSLQAVTDRFFTTRNSYASTTIAKDIQVNVWYFSMMLMDAIDGGGRVESIRQ